MTAADPFAPDEPTDARLAASGLFGATEPADEPEPDPGAQVRPCGCKGGDPVQMDPEAQIRDLWAAVGECQLRVIDRDARRDTLAEILTVVLVGFAIGMAVDIVRGGAVIDTTGRG